MHSYWFAVYTNEQENIYKVQVGLFIFVASFTKGTISGRDFS